MSTSSSGRTVANDDFAATDSLPFGEFQRRTIITTGLGVFCDGYDLSSIGLVLPLVLSSYGIDKLTNVQSGTLVASALLGSAIGALFFGALAQRGRLRFYGIDVLIMGIAALAQAFMPNITLLIVVRFILGIGVGADYVLSPTILGEHSNAPDRGRSFGISFNVMWVIGALVAALLNLTLHLAGVSPDLQWRIVLAAGVIPALGVLYYRRTMPETPRYLARVAQDPEAAAQALKTIIGDTHTLRRDTESLALRADTRPFWAVFAKHAPMIFLAGVFWAVYDMVSFSSLLFGPSLIGHSLGMKPIEFQIMVSVLGYIPAQLMAAYIFVDRVGRKRLQTVGYILAAILLAIFAAMKPLFISIPVVAFVVYLLYIYSQSGPALVSSSGLLGVEFSPTRIRSFAQSVTVAMGRIGAAIITFLFPLLFRLIGESNAVFVLCGLAAIGAALTWFLLPETKGQSLEAITEMPTGKPGAVAGVVRK